MQLFDLNNFNHKKDYVIEASAGTGKTYSITKIVEKLVNEHNEDLNSILIVTYTEKAAGELKDRIKEALKNINVDNAPIYTIHSFCQKVIKEFGLSANLPLELNVIDESEIVSFCDKYIREGDILEDISAHKVGLKGFDEEKVKDVLIAAIKKYYLDLNGNEDPSIIVLDDYKEECEEDDFVTFCMKAKSFEEILDFDEEFNYYYNVLKNSDNSKLNELAKVISENYKNDFYYDGVKYKYNKSMNLEEGKAFNFFKEIKALFKGFKPEPVVAFKYVHDFYQKWQLEKENKKCQVFDDMIRYVREGILHNPLLKEKLKNKFKRAIIDEFQDTNQRQFDIFSGIFMEDDDHKIIVVGDPKQSIYSFQGADVNVYYKAVEAIEAKGGIKCMLNKNYRSTEDMVSSCNKLFNYYDFDGTEFNDCGFLSPNNGDKEFHEVLYDGKETKAFWMHLSNSNDGEFDGVDEREFALQCAKQIIDCCSIDVNGKTKLQIRPKDKQFRNVSFKDFAVLARTSSEMVEIEKVLKNSGIPYIRYKDKNLFLGTECEQWVCLLEAINLVDFTGKNRKVLKKALFTSFFGLSLSEISSNTFNKDDIKEVELIRKWRMFLLNNKWEDLFDDIIISSNISERMKSLKEIQSLSIFKQISSYCIEYLSKGKSIEDLIRNLKNLSKGGNFDSDEQNGNIIEKSTNFDCVQIMTIHASKGLQFPVVLGVCGFRQPISSVSVTSFHKDNKQVLSFRTCEEYKNEQIAEWKRLFYVAYTRAQFIMILPKYKKNGADFLGKSVDEFIINNQDSFRVLPNMYKSYQKLRDEVSAILKASNNIEDDLETKENQNKALKLIINDLYTKGSYKHSYSSLSHNEDETLLDETFENKEGITEEGLSKYDKNSIVINGDYNQFVNPISIASDFPKGAKTGTILHEVFENLDYQNYELYLEDKIIKCFQNQAMQLKEGWMESVKDIVHNVLSAKLPIINGKNNTNEYLLLKDINFNNKLDEVEFNFNLLNQNLKNYCNGFVDMMFKNGEYYSIVDWKSDSLNDNFSSYSDNLELRKHVNECYSIQRVLYSYCLIKWLKTSYPTLTEQEIFDNHFGGVYYVFIKGCNENTSNGIYCQTWNSWDDLKQSFTEIISDKIGGRNNE